MAGCRVIKSHFGFGGVVYNRGEVVELSEKDALYYISENVVIPNVDVRLPSETDVIVDSVRSENTKLKELVKVQTAEVARLTEELHKMQLKIGNLVATKKK